MSSQNWPHPLALGQEELVTSLPLSTRQLHMFNRQVRVITMLEVCVLCFVTYIMFSSSTVSACLIKLYMNIADTLYTLMNVCISACG